MHKDDDHINPKKSHPVNLPFPETLDVPGIAMPVENKRKHPSQ
jgi:hypothetical protein